MEASTVVASSSVFPPHDIQPGSRGLCRGSTGGAGNGVGEVEVPQPAELVGATERLDEIGVLLEQRLDGAWRCHRI